jgi:hypothetical protein
MEQSIDRTQDLSGSSLPFQNLEEGFDDWVRELRLVLLTQEASLRIPSFGKRTGQEHNVEPRSEGGTLFNMAQDLRGMRRGAGNAER